MKKTSKRKRNPEQTLNIYFNLFSQKCQHERVDLPITDQACLYQCLQVVQQEAFSSLLLLIKFFQWAFFFLFHAKRSPSVGFLCTWCYFGIAVLE